MSACSRVKRKKNVTLFVTIKKNVNDLERAQSYS